MVILEKSKGGSMKKGSRGVKGFTLSEMLVVLIVIGVLGMIAYPMYSRVIKRSRVSDALNVLSLASKKQEAYLVNNERYARTFNELRAPVKGLEGGEGETGGGVEVGNFRYRMEGRCIIAEREGYRIYKNYKTDKEKCIGEKCREIEDLVGGGSEEEMGCGVGEEEGWGWGGEGGVEECKEASCCKEGYMWNGVECVVKGGEKCSGDNWINKNGVCVCKSGGCGAGKERDESKDCRCECKDKNCTGGKILRDSDCQCVCPAGEYEGEGGKCKEIGKCENEPGEKVEEEECGEGKRKREWDEERCEWGKWDESECEAEECDAKTECIDKVTKKCVTKPTCPCDDGIAKRKKTCRDGSEQVWTWVEREGLECPGWDTDEEEECVGIFD
jgi:prepilin-type N-terminal cleavage/methylation domain-containing protein